MKKLVLALALALIFTAFACVAISAVENTTNETADTAAAIELGATYDGTLSQDHFVKGIAFIEDLAAMIRNAKSS